MPIASLGNLFGGPDMIIILVVVLLLFGAKKLPELARGLGQSLNEFKKAREDFEHELRQGQQDVQAREASNRQPYTPAAPAAVPAQALSYTPPTEAVVTPASDAAMQQRIAELEEKLRVASDQTKNTPSSVS